jgi:hypothetical protein
MHTRVFPRLLTACKTSSCLRSVRILEKRKAWCGVEGYRGCRARTDVGDNYLNYLIHGTNLFQMRVLHLAIMITNYSMSTLRV